MKDYLIVSLSEIRRWLKVEELVDCGTPISHSLAERIRGADCWKFFFHIEETQQGYNLWSRKVWEESNQRATLRKKQSDEFNRLHFLRKDCLKEITNLFVTNLLFKEDLAEYTAKRLMAEKTLEKVDLLFKTNLNEKYKEIL